MSVEPIKPEDVAGAKLKVLPDEVIEAFNELIARKWNGSKSTLKQDEVIELILEKFRISPTIRQEEVTRGTVFKECWLDIEDIYRGQGWVVEYDKPGCGNETYGASYTFRKPGGTPTKD